MSTVCVHGLGYVGLPTAAMLATHGHAVAGYDTDDRILDRLLDGEAHFDEPGLNAVVERALEDGRFEPCHEVVPAEYHVICVPTPFDPESKSAQLAHVRAAAQSIGIHLRPGDTVVLESTVPPGTTEGLVRPILEESGLSVGSDVELAFCPETVLPGNVIAELRENDRVIGGVDGSPPDATVALYESFGSGRIFTVADATTAEFVKLIQNTYRDVNIGLANELAKIAYDYGVDVREGIDLANLHPRVNLLQPGPGVGGHCLPIDPWFLGRESEHLDLIARARRVNDSMVDYVIDRLEAQLGSLQGRRIAVLGAAYKANVDDTRRSPGLRLARRLANPTRTADSAIATADGGDQVVGAPERAGQEVPPGRGEEEAVDVVLCDPRVDDPALDIRDVDEAVTDADAIVLAAAHDEFAALDPERVAARMHRPLIFDTRGVIDDTEWTDAGFTIGQL